MSQLMTALMLWCSLSAVRQLRPLSLLCCGSASSLTWPPSISYRFPEALPQINYLHTDLHLGICFQETQPMSEYNLVLPLCYTYVSALILLNKSILSYLVVIFQFSVTALSFKTYAVGIHVKNSFFDITNWHSQNTARCRKRILLGLACMDVQLRGEPSSPGLPPSPVSLCRNSDLPWTEGLQVKHSCPLSRSRPNKSR